MEKAIIVGAGPAGLTAAYELLTRTNIKPVIIEMDNQVGGLSKTINYKGNLIDLGGHRFFSKSARITDWWLQFLPLAQDTETVSLKYHNQTTDIKNTHRPDSANGHMLIRPRKSRIYFNHSFFDYPLSFSKKTLRNFSFGQLNRIGLSYLTSKIFPYRKVETLEQFFINRFGKELYLNFFKDYTEKVWGVPCHEIPASWGQQRIKDLNIGKAIRQSISSLFSTNKTIRQEGVSTSLIDQFLYPEKGPGQLWETVAKKILALGGEIYPGYQCEKVRMEDYFIRSVQCREISSGDQKNFAGDYFFSTIPVKNLVASFENIEVPAAVKQVAGNLSYRDFIMVGMLFRKPENKSDPQVELTDNWIYLQDRDLVAGRMQIFNNWSPYMVQDKNNLWIGMEYFCSTTDQIWNLPEEEMVALALREIRRTELLGSAELLDATVIKVPKAYPSYIGAYERFDEVRIFLDQIENLYLLGRNGMHRYNNADHSMMTAMIAVDNIIAGQKDRNNIWAVNMEQDFHESPGSITDNIS
jgi:protoporphyrinogen oxidase